MSRCLQCLCWNKYVCVCVISLTLVYADILEWIIKYERKIFDKLKKTDKYNKIGSLS